MILDREAELGRRFPPEIRSLYRFANGLWLFREEVLSIPIEVLDIIETSGGVEVYETFEVVSRPHGTVGRETGKTGRWHFYAHEEQDDARGACPDLSFTTLSDFIEHLLARAEASTGQFHGLEVPNALAP
jgi:hypothetical protein